MSNSRRWQSRVVLPLLLFNSFTSAIVLGTQTSASAQVSASDLQGHWAQRCIAALAQRNIITPINGSFRPDTVVSRTDYVTTVRRAFPAISPLRKPIRFRDVSSNAPTAKDIQYAQQAGFLIWELKDEFKPTELVSRAQAFGGIASGLRYTTKQAVSRDFKAVFKDGRMVPDYAKGSLAAALENRLIINQPDVRRLNPNQPITRAELATSICQALPGTTAFVPIQYVARTGPSGASVPPSTPPKPNNPGSNPPGVVVVPVIDDPGKPVSGPLPDPIIPTPNPGSPLPPVHRFPSKEIRAAWLTNIDSYVLFNPRLMREAMNELARLKFNTVYPVVWNWGYTQYPSAVAKREIGHAVDPRPAGLQGRDALAEMIQLGRQNKIAVIPWFEFGFMTTAESELAARRPDWLTQRKDGSKIWQEGQYQRLWLNPLKPEVQDFILELILEVVTQYGVDGIQFDDHMGLPSDFGYDPYTVELYKKEHNGKEPPANPKNPEWLRWRADKITEFMGRVFRAIKVRKPYITVALTPNSQKFSYENYLQDWVTWRRRGYVEELILQVYRSDLNSFIAELSQPEVLEAQQHIPVGVGILTGLKGKPVPIVQVQEQIQVARDLGFVGVSFFFFETMWNLSNESPEFRKAGFDSLFTPAVPRPSLVGGWTSEVRK